MDEIKKHNKKMFRLLLMRIFDITELLKNTEFMPLLATG